MYITYTLICIYIISIYILYIYHIHIYIYIYTHIHIYIFTYLYTLIIYTYTHIHISRFTYITSIRYIRYITYITDITYITYITDSVIYDLIVSLSSTLQEVHLPGSGYISGLSGCGLGVLLDAAIPQTKALAAELRRYFPRLPAVPSRTLSAGFSQTFHPS